MISWPSQSTWLKLPGPADLIYSTLGRSGPFSQNMVHNSLFRLLFCPDLTIAMLSWQVFQPVIKPLELIQKAAARLDFNKLKWTHVIPLFINLHWLPITAHIKFKALVFAYKTPTGSAPLYLNSLLQTYMASRSLRSASEGRNIVQSLPHKNLVLGSSVGESYFK